MYLPQICIHITSASLTEKFKSHHHKCKEFYLNIGNNLLIIVIYNLVLIEYKKYINDASIPKYD